MFGLFAGAWCGYYLCAVQESYLRAYTSANEAFLLLDLLASGHAEQIEDLERMELLSGFATIERLPVWAYRFNTANPDSPLPNEKIQDRIRLALATIESNTLASYGLTENAVKRIVDVHFSHYETTQFHGDQIDVLLDR